MEAESQASPCDDWISSLPTSNAERVADSSACDSHNFDRSDEEWEQDVRRLAKRDAIDGACSQPACLAGWGLFLGDCEDADDYGNLESLGIGAVLNLAPTDCKQKIVNFGSTYPKDLVVLDIETEDDEMYPLLKMHLAVVEAFLDQHRAEGRKVLVHCFAGLNRSAALCTAYLIRRDRMSLLDAVRLLNTKRGRVLSNQGFVKQIVALARTEQLLG